MRRSVSSAAMPTSKLLMRSVPPWARATMPAIIKPNPVCPP